MKPSKLKVEEKTKQKEFQHQHTIAIPLTYIQIYQVIYDGSLILVAKRAYIKKFNRKHTGTIMCDNVD